jgi:hypothetical protein
MDRISEVPMKKISSILFLAAAFSLSALSQVQQETPDTRPIVLEIQQSKSMRFSYQRIGGSGLFGGFQFVPDWKPATDSSMIQGISLRSRNDDGIIKVKVALVEGKYLETEVPVGEYTITEGSRLVIKELAKFGVVPFEVSLVRAPATVAELPDVVNKTKALRVEVEPVVSNLPSFKVRLFNISNKAVMSYCSETSIGTQRHLIGISRNLNGTVLIEPGQFVEKILPYPLKPLPSSTGHTPEPMTGLVLTIQSAIFSDGTYEGDSMPAAKFRAIQIGQKIAVQHILTQLRVAYDSTEAFAAAMSDHTVPMDEAVFKNYLKEFPGLAERDIGQLKEMIEGTAFDAHRDFLRVFTRDQKEFAKNGQGLQNWINAEIELCQRVLDSIP